MAEWLPQYRGHAEVRAITDSVNSPIPSDRAPSPRIQDERSLHKPRGRRQAHLEERRHSERGWGKE